MDAKKETIKTYNKIASGYSASHFVHFWLDEFKQFKRLISGKKVIDLGCGAGRDATVFVNNGFDYIGIDTSKGMLEVAKNRVTDGKFWQMDFSQTDFSDETFDGFWAAASFLHLPKKDLSDALREAGRITKKDDIGFISVKEKTDMDEGFIYENKYGGITRFFSFYSQDEFKKILEDNNFQVIDMTTHLEDDGRKTNWLCYFVRV